MNQGHTADMYYQQHMSGPAPPPQTVASHYQPQNPPLLQPGPAQYPPPSAYGQQYGYANGLTSPPTGPPNVSTPMGAQNVLPLPGVNQPGMAPAGYAPGFDTTGQVQPPGMKPRVTATLWEDEGSLCFQVEARGICVARREDNHMINGTKLLNVAGMTRGRRDGILKSEKVRHVVKIGPMHLKGVWIPFERALDFANKEKITELLYPLFVHNIGALLYHPTNQTRTSQVMAAAERRKQEQNSMRGSQPPGLPSMQPHHHHSIPPGLPGHAPPQPPMGGRPSIDRAHTFPTPPTSASSVMGGGMGASDNFQWSQQGMPNGQGANPMSIDTGLSNARSMPTTPATTPPGSSIQSMQSYPPVSQSYDASRGMYNVPPPQHSPYAPNPASAQDHRSSYSQPSYVKNEMGPPSSRPAVSGGEQSDQKSTNGLVHQGHSSENHHAPEEEAEHEAEYTHDSSAYDASRNAYSYNPPAPVNSMPGEHTQMSPEMTGSPHHTSGSGRATPRTATAPQTYYGQTGYSTPPRVQAPSSNLYSVMSNDRSTSNGAPGNEMYSTQGEIQNGYSAQPPVLNGTSTGMKRGRDDEEQRPPSVGPGMGYDHKRRKTLIDGQIPSMASPVYNTQPVAEMTGQSRR